MINIRGCTALACFALLATGLAHSTEPKRSIQPRHQSPGGTTCTVVREFVTLMGEAKAEAMAREAGASEARLAAARKCLK
jgi:hypothetical protein